MRWHNSLTAELYHKASIHHSILLQDESHSELIQCKLGSTAEVSRLQDKNFKYITRFRHMLPHLSHPPDLAFTTKNKYSRNNPAERVLNC